MQGISMIRRARLAIAVLGAILLGGAAAAPADAGFGAVAYDQYTGKFGATWNEPTQSRAFETALRQCASPDCRVYPVEPAGCGALALSNQDKAWAGADRETLEDARRDAVERCQSRTTNGICEVRVAGCNK
jgi:hypothetical protein